MDFLSQVSKLKSKYQLEEILMYLYYHPADFENIFSLAFETDEKKAWRILWIVEKVSYRQPELFDAAKIRQLQTMLLTTQHAGMRRIGLSILLAFPVLTTFSVELLNRLYDWMLNTSLPVAIQVNAMKLLYQFSKTDPYLLKEFITVLEHADEQCVSSAFTASRRNLLKRHR